jgi:nucleoside phosphorylase
VYQIGSIVAAACCLVSLVGCSSMRAMLASSEAREADVDVAIITVLPEEYHAVLRKLENVRHVIEPDGRANVYVWATGEIRSDDPTSRHRLVVAMAGEAGEVSGALATKRTIDRWNPRDVLLVGIAGGVNDSVELGDVVVSSQIWGYEHGHLGSHYDTGGAFFFLPAPALLKAARDLGPGWRRRIEVSAPTARVRSKVVEGRTASGDKVIESTNSNYFAESIRLQTFIISVDMEGAGAAAAVAKDHESGGTTGFLMIRGISDLVEKNGGGRGRNPQRDQWKRYAADVAASFAVHLVESSGSD